MYHNVTSLLAFRWCGGNWRKYLLRIGADLMSGVHDKLSVQCKYFLALCESLKNIVIFGHVATSTLKKHELPSLLLPRIKAIYVFTTCQGLFLVVELT